MKEKRIWLFELLLLAMSALTVYFYYVAFSEWKVALYVVCVIAFFLEGGGMFFLLFAARKFPRKRVILFSVLCGVFFVVVILWISYVVNFVTFFIFLGRVSAFRFTLETSVCRHVTYAPPRGSFFGLLLLPDSNNLFSGIIE